MLTVDTSLEKRKVIFLNIHINSSELFGETRNPDRLVFYGKDCLFAISKGYALLSA